MQYMNFNEGFSMYYDISLDLPWPCNNFVERKGSKASFLYILKKKKKRNRRLGVWFGRGLVRGVEGRWKAKVTAVPIVIERLQRLPFCFSGKAILQRPSMPKLSAGADSFYSHTWLLLYTLFGNCFLAFQH